MERITFTEFLEWIQFLEQEEWHKRTKLEYYLAQIAAEMRRSTLVAADAKKVKISDYLLSFGEQTGADPEERIKHSKQTWASILGVNIGKN